MKTQIALLTLASLSTVSQALSPVPPSIDRNFELSCMIDLGIVQEDAQGGQISYDTLRGTLELDKRSLNDEGLAAKIRWTKWDYEAQRSVRARLSDLPGQPRIEELSFDAMGDGEGNIGSFSVTMDTAFLRAGMGVKTEAGTYFSAETRGDDAKAEAVRLHQAGKTRYVLDIACGLHE